MSDLYLVPKKLRTTRLINYHMLLTLLINNHKLRNGLSQRNVSSSSVNGDIAIQWEWSKFGPSQNPNPLTDYDKTLHN